MITPGKEGLTAKTYEVIKENGKEVSRKVISEKMLKEKQDQVVAVGPKEVSQAALLLVAARAARKSL